MIFFLKKVSKYFAGYKNCCTFASSNKTRGLVAQLNRASDYGSEGYRFESCRDHKGTQSSSFFLLFPTQIGCIWFAKTNCSRYIYTA